MESKPYLHVHCKGYRIVFASIRALCLFLPARAVVKFVLQAATTLENTTSEQQRLHKFTANFTHRFISPVRLVP